MTNWLFEQTLIISVLVVLLGLSRQPLRDMLGAKGAYILWSIVPLQLLMSMLVSSQHIPLQIQVNPSFNRASSLINSYQPDFVEYAIAPIWLIGVALSVLLVAYQHQRFIRQLNLAEVKAPREEMGLQTKLFSGSQVSTPMVLGFFDKKLIVPESFFSLSSSTQNMILEHELTHLRRGDLYWNTVALGVVCLFWYNPLAWWALKHYRQSQEIACDANVLDGKTPSQKLEYAKSFLTHSLGNRHQPLTALNYNGKEAIRERLINIHSGYSWSWALFPTAAMLLLTTFSINAITSGDKTSDAASVMPVYRTQPVYPQQAAVNGIEGSVTLSFSINTNGTVSNVKVISSTQSGVFETSAIEAVNQWQYSTTLKALHDQRVVLNYLLDEA